MQTKPFILAAKGQRGPRTPIWFLRQAGRYLPEYRAVRANYDFVQMCQDSDAAAEVTLQPLRRYDLDAAIIFSDILIPCIGMGQELTFDKGHGPRLNTPIRTNADLKNLRVPDADKEFAYVGDAISKVCAKLGPQQTMIGFAGAPLTVATYMIEGEGSRDHVALKKMLYTEPNTFSSLLSIITDTTIDYLKMQCRAGAEALMIFDTWAGSLTPDEYAKHVVPQLVKLFTSLKTLSVPLIYFPGQGTERYPELKPLFSLVDALHVDWRVDLGRAIAGLKQLGFAGTIQGNLEPTCFLGSKEIVQAKTNAVLRHGQSAKSHIFNVGHGLIPEIPPESLTWAIDAVRAFDRARE